MRIHKHTPEIPMIVLTDDPAVRGYADALFDTDVPVAIVSASYADVVPYMLGNNGHTVALVADVDDPEQLAAAILTVERRLGTVGSVIRYGADLPTSPLPTAA
ncbi:hypothetical protein ABLE92_01535 [Gordonia sp. VNQ95]|jgi:hypothetical protein|uniref:hypothetical protein n=1 Tax=Gordonia TaxID=2053 RepID=UPI0032B3167F